MDTRRIGEVVDSRFVTERCAGSGGMGAVYAARDLQSGNKIALKVVGQRLWPTEGDNATLTSSGYSRFEREVRILAQLDHPNVVRYLGHGRTEGGQPYLAMEWLEGESLSQRLAKGPLPIPDAIRLFQRIAEALGYAHGRHVVHRDVKPSNIFLIDGDLRQPKLIDFGLARDTEVDECTASGVVIGTPGYMSPEQARGLRAVDTRTDVFALGCVVYRALAGKLPFDGDEPLAILARILFDSTPRITDVRADVPPDLEEVLVRMLAKEPDARPIDGNAVAELIDAISRGGTLPREASSGSHPALSSAERRLVCVVAVAPGAAGQAAVDAPTMQVSSAAAVRQRVGEIATRYGAHTEWLVDGSIVAVMRLHGVATDRAASAAKCALELRQLLSGASIALATGRAELMAGEALGEVLGRAAKLLAVPRSAITGVQPIRIDDVTAGLVGRRFEIGRDLSSLLLRSEREVGERPRPLLGRITPFVGRERELGALLAMFEECVQERSACVAVVTGPAGSGKSRLRDEFVRRTPQQSPFATIWVAQGDPIATGSSFALVREILARAIGIYPSDSRRAKRASLRQRVSMRVKPERRARVLAFLAELVGVPLDASDATNPLTALGSDLTTLMGAARQDAVLMADEIRSAWIDFVAAECEEQPLLIVLEDLQWGDVPSVRFLDVLLRDLSERPIMILATARPEVHDVFPRLWDDRSLQELCLAPLSVRSSRRLVVEVLGDVVAESTVKRIVELSAGNAFYLEELIRATSQRGLEESPSTILAMIEARLEQVTPDDRLVLRAASIFGNSFWRDGVHALINDASPAMIDASIHRLVESELIRPRAESAFRDEREYSFRHELVRQASYDMLTHVDREAGHRLCAAWLKRQGESSALRLAEHHERGVERGPAATAYLAAATEALAANDFDAVIAHGDRGIRNGAAGEELAKVKLVQAEALRWRGDLAPAKRCSAEALALLPEGSALWYDAAAEHVFATSRLGEVQAPLKLAEHLRTLGANGAVSDAYLIAAARTIAELAATGERAIVSGLQRIILRETNAPRVLSAEVRARIHVAHAVCALARGEVGGHYDHAMAAVSCFEQAKDSRAAYAQLAQVGLALVQCAQFAQAEKMLKTVVEESDRLGLRSVAAVARAHMAIALVATGQLDVARATANAAVDALVRYACPRLEAIARTNFARVLEATGQLDAAERQARIAIAIRHGANGTRAYSLAVLAEVLLVARKAPAAVEAGREAYTALCAFGSVDDGEAFIRLVFARALIAMNQHAAAADVLRAAKERIAVRAGTIRQPELASGFLERVPENVATLQA